MSDTTSQRRPFSRAWPRPWWRVRTFYVRYMAREVSSFFVGTYAALMSFGLLHLALGPAAWDKFLWLLSTPVSVVYHLLALAFCLYHTVTWFAVTPRTMPLMAGDDFVPPKLIVLGQYAAWAGVTLIILAAAVW